MDESRQKSYSQLYIYRSKEFKKCQTTISIILYQFCQSNTIYIILEYNKHIMCGLKLKILCHT